MPPLAEIAAYLGIGAVVGFFAGLLGIGGAVIIVSSLALMFTARGYPASFVMHLAIGTSLAAMAAGALSSLRAHHARGAVDVALVKTMTPGLLAGVFVGALLARFAPTAFLKYFFLGFVLFNTAQMAFNLRPTPSRALPGRGALLGIAVAIGACSSLFGGGAAAVGIPFLTWCNVNTHRAIGTVAAMAFPLAIAGTLGYIVSGWSVENLPPWSLGFVYLPAFLGISATSAVTAPLGARLAHRLKGATLRRIFAVFLIVMGLKVAVSV
ncbi:MAG TPA: sulfite exporter TauE/SafE family protein [Usitatibacter sp.]|nr:sulfite exporter TauE/SafE family protein [Usitatibacter sp.]